MNMKVKYIIFQNSFLQYLHVNLISNGSDFTGEFNWIYGNGNLTSNDAKAEF